MSKGVLCITGMGRSGTSLTTSWMERCGLTVHDGNLLQANSGNVRGHFEDEDFLNFHAEAILRHDAHSQGWKIYPDHFLSFSDEELRRARNMVATREAKYSLWGWKDPRTVLFLPEWKRIVPELKVLLVWRPCAQVVRSLLKRSQQAQHPHLHVSPSQAVALWQSYNERACEYKRLYPADTVLLPLSVVLQHDHRAYEEVNARLELGLHYAPMSELYTPSLLHSEPSSRLMRQLAAIRFRSRDMEKRLQDLSDLSVEKISGENLEH